MQGGKKYAQQGRQHHERRLTGNDPDCLRIGGGYASGLWQYDASSHLRSRVHDYSSPAFDKQARQIIVGEVKDLSTSEKFSLMCLVIDRSHIVIHSF